MIEAHGKNQSFPAADIKPEQIMIIWQNRWLMAEIMQGLTE